MSEALLFEVKLTLDELRMLDSTKVSKEVRDKIITASGAHGCALHYGVTEREGLFLQHVRELALDQKYLSPRACRIENCRLCGKGPNIVLYQSGRNKGQEKSRYGNPGYEFKESCVRIAGYAACGCCAQCFERLLPHIREQIKDIEAEVSEKITGHPNKWKRYQNRRCTKCGWAGHEGQMLRELTIMGDGHYPAGCPECKVKNLFLGQVFVKTEPGYTVVPVQQKAPE